MRNKTTSSRVQAKAAGAQKRWCFAPCYQGEVRPPMSAAAGLVGACKREPTGSWVLPDLLLSPSPAAALEPSPSLANPHFQHWAWSLWVNILLKVIHLYTSTLFQNGGCKLSRSCTDGWRNSHAHLETLDLSNWVSGWLSPDLQSRPLSFPHVTKHVQVRHLCSWRVREHIAFFKNKF